MYEFSKKLSISSGLLHLFSVKFSHFIKCNSKFSYPLTWSSCLPLINKFWFGFTHKFNRYSYFSNKFLYEPKLSKVHCSNSIGIEVLFNIEYPDLFFIGV